MSGNALRTKNSAVSESDPLWYKDAVIYQIHVRSFYDSNGDGIGDFKGLTQKLDYIQDLGVTAIWLLPFFPSPLRDDGYDIADYRNVNPTYGTLRDFKAFLREAHQRDLKVVTELVMNHTSDQHEWFQKSRAAKPGSKWRDYYVWSDDPTRYADARIIFQDFEASNWTWDPVANAYFWHRFYHHQPDLNFDNPEVRREMTRVVDFWLDMGVDGLRLDAVPYLFEREGTNCENLPETHVFLRDLREHVDSKYHARFLLAEANQWPEDAVAYFGAGDECHMNFHFPLMPRLFMAAEREDRFPIIDILEQTPQLPEKAQWAIFLRNHDELTLEMVTDEERDYMYRVYAEDPRSRVNLGIRRRLAPLLRNNRRKIELMNALLLSLPGTPIIYYGDEIGMGDNIYLGDRDGVRTPMQWNPDRNAGFSKVNPHRLFLPVIIESEYHFTARNVETEKNSPHSLLWWMQRIISLRKQFRSFGRGTLEFLTPDNSKILAYLRELDGEIILVVANLSRFTQCAELDLARFRGSILVEQFGQTNFPPIGELPYFITLGPHGFYWFRIQGVDEGSVLSLSLQEIPERKVARGWESLFKGRARASLESALPGYLRAQPWFTRKDRVIQSAALVSYFPIHGESAEPQIYLLLVRVSYVNGEPDQYLMPVIFADPETAANIRADHPGTAILGVHDSTSGSRRVLCDATWERETWKYLLDAINARRSFKGSEGEVRAFLRRGVKRLKAEELQHGQVTVQESELSNASAVLDNRFLLKLFRRIDEGVNPELELGQFLNEKKFEHAPRLEGHLTFASGTGKAEMTFGTLQEYCTNAGGAWGYTMDELGRYFERISSESTESGKRQPLLSPKERSLLALSRTEAPEEARSYIGSFLQSTELMGRRVGELHRTLSSARGKSPFAPESFSKLYQRGIYQSMRMLTRRTMHLLSKRVSELPEASREEAEKLMAREEEMLEFFGRLLSGRIPAKRIRCHGDLHLQQLLFTGKDFVIIDFEGEPERAIGERRIKASPLKDVAAMIRSFHYASHAALSGRVPGVVLQKETAATWLDWTRFWFSWCAGSFLGSYLKSLGEGDLLPSDDASLELLLDIHLLEKALYELNYELNHRLDWVSIPLAGVSSLLDRRE